MCANRQGEGQDVSYVRSEPGEYYLDINSANMDWDVSVEQLVPVAQHSTSRVAPVTFPEVVPSMTAIPDEIQDLLTEWSSATIARDSERLANCYLPVVDVYFLKRDMRREEIKADKDNLFRRYTEIVRYQLTDLRLDSIGPDTASINFKKAWDVRGSDTFIGLERQQLVMKKSRDGRWKIAGERELQILKAAHS